MTATFVTHPSAPESTLTLLRIHHPTLPSEYFDFLAEHNGAEGSLGIDPGWFIVWPAEDALVATSDYQLPMYLPGYFAFGSNGGGELFVFATIREIHDSSVFMVPAIGKGKEVLVRIASSFAEFSTAMGKEFT
jgi:hypothetical protein